MKSDPIKLTANFAKNVPTPSGSYVIYRDSNLKGFALRVTSGGTRTFVIEKRVNGNVRRIKIGRYPELTAEQARRQAQRLLGEIALGINPIAELKKMNPVLKTLGGVYDEYKAVRRLKPSTLRDYDAAIRQAFVNWKDLTISDITPAMVVERYCELSTIGKTTASRHMRCLRAVFNFAQVNYVDDEGMSLLKVNPVNRLTALKAWHRPKRRQRNIRNHELVAWYKSVNNLEGTGTTFEHAEVAKDYMLFLLFTGLRRGEAARLRWSDVDLKAADFGIEDTKNGSSHSLPLSDYLLEILLRRSALRVNEFVFPGKGPSGHIVNVYKHMSTVKARSGIDFSLHDLRRTFITAADSLDISAYVMKRLVNHRLPTDVTGGYIVSGTDRLRKPMQLITNYLLHQCGIRENVAKLRGVDETSSNEVSPMQTSSSP